MNAQMIRLKMMVVVCLQFVTGSLPAQLAGGFELTPNSGRQVQSQEVVITWPEKNDELRGFSTKIGDWEILKIAPQVKIDPVAASNVAAVRFDDSIAAFSGEKGGWDVIELSTESKSFPACHPSLVVIEDNGHLDTFSAPTGRWTSPTDPELQEQNRTLEVRYPRTSSPTVFVDVNNRMKKFEKWRDSLPAYKRRGILLSVTSGAGTGTATLSASRLSWMTELEAKVRELFNVVDMAESDSSISGVNPDAPNAKVLEHRIEDLQAELSALEQKVRSSSQSPSSFNSKAGQRYELRKLVEQSFDLRQQLQGLEAQRLKVKLQQVENNLVVRAKSRDAIVDRRLGELFTTLASAESSEKLPGFDGIRLLAFHSPWAHGIEMKAIWENLERSGLPVEAVEIAKERKLAIEYNVMRVPTSVLVVDGKEVRRFVGNTSEWELRRALNEQREARARPTPTPEFSSSSQPNPGSDARIQSSKPTEVVKELRSLRKRMTSYHRQSETFKENVAMWSQSLDKLIAGGHLEQGSADEKRESNLIAAQEQLDQINKLIREKQRDWDYAWSAYQTQLQLLRLDVEEATNELNSLTANKDRLQQLAEKEVATHDEVQASVSAVASGKIRLQRAEQVLKLYADIEAKEPELNPIFVSLDKKPAVNTATDSAVPTTESTSGETPEK